MAPHVFPFVLLVALFEGVASGFCPKGFGSESFFPKEWKIPKWPSDLSLEVAGELRTVTLGGFNMQSINEEYLEGPGNDFVMQGRETYWQASGQYFMYFCERYQKWRIAEISAFSQNMDGNCFSFVSMAEPGRDIQDPALVKFWIEVEKGEWQPREEAGVMKLGKLADQYELEEQDGDFGGQDSKCDTESEADAQSEVAETGEAPPFGTEKKSNCPVMPAVRKVKEKVLKAGKAAGNWARRLFPKLLGAPDEEDIIPEGNPLFDEDEPMGEVSKCQPATEEGCSFKEKFYIEKQKNKTKEETKAEVNRLKKMQGAAMKPEHAAWLAARIHINKQLYLLRAPNPEL